MDEFYEAGNCVKCHVTSCTQCHSITPHDGKDTASEISTCDKCHQKKQASYSGYMPFYKSEGPSADIHYEAGMVCSDCHSSTDIHGDGESYTDMTEAVKTECEDCHEQDQSIEAHSTHGDKLDCAACHQKWTVTCVNCHLDTKKTDGIVIDEFFLLQAGDGQIKPFMKQSSSLDGEMHIAYAEYFSHTISDEPHDCKFCHENLDVFTPEPGQLLGPEGAKFVSQETLDKIVPPSFLEKLNRWIFE